MGLMTDAEAELFRGLLHALEVFPNQLRQKLAQEMWASIALTVDESIYQQSLPVGTPLVLVPQFSQQIVVRSIVAIVPNGATGLVQLGNLTLPCSAGPNVFAPVEKQLGGSDTRSLTLAGSAGPAALWITGQQLPTTGVLAP